MFVKPINLNKRFKKKQGIKTFQKAFYIFNYKKSLMKGKHIITEYSELTTP